MRAQKTIQMAEIALMSAVLCVISPFTIPVPMSPVPLSLALFGVYLAAVLLGAKRGAICVLIYLLLGLVGLPVFSGFSGGIGVLAGPTGGYIIGYVLCALVIGLLVEQGMHTIFTMTLGTLVCYCFGTIWFLIIMKGTYTLIQALLVCVVPYLIFDLIKILAAAAVAVPIRKIVRRMERR